MVHSIIVLHHVTSRSHKNKNKNDKENLKCLSILNVLKCFFFFFIVAFTFQSFIINSSSISSYIDIRHFKLGFISYHKHTLYKRLSLKCLLLFMINFNQLNRVRFEKYVFAFSLFIAFCLALSVSITPCERFDSYLKENATARIITHLDWVVGD